MIGIAALTTNGAKEPRSCPQSRWSNIHLHRSNYATVPVHNEGRALGFLHVVNAEALGEEVAAIFERFTSGYHFYLEDLRSGESVELDHSVLTLSAYAAGLGLILSLPFAVADWRWPAINELPLLLSMGATGLCTLVFYTRGMQLGDAVAMAPANAAGRGDHDRLPGRWRGAACLSPTDPMPCRTASRRPYRSFGRGSEMGRP